MPYRADRGLWTYVVALVGFAIMMYCASEDCDKKAKLMGGKPHLTRSDGCLVEMPNGYLRAPQ